MINKYRLVSIELYRELNIADEVDKILIICRSCLYTDISIEQIKLALISKDRTARNMMFNILKSTNLEKSYKDLFEDITYYQSLHPDINIKIAVNEIT